jgi:hypothetical protein
MVQMARAGSPVAVYFCMLAFGMAEFRWHMLGLAHPTPTAKPTPHHTTPHHTTRFIPARLHTIANPLHPCWAIRMHSLAHMPAARSCAKPNRIDTRLALTV